MAIFITSTLPREILARLQSGDASWETMGLPAAVRVIKEQKLLGFVDAPRR